MFSDSVLEKQALSANKFVRKTLLHSLVKRKKVTLLERLYPLLKQQKGPEVAFDILHGCRFDSHEV